MIRKRQHKVKQRHILILANRSASNFTERAVRKLSDGIRRQGGFYTLIQPDSPMDFLQFAQSACGLRRWTGQEPPNFRKRGKVTALVAAGGDGTVNLAARVAQKANLPLGIVPMGRFNNIALGLYGSNDTDPAIGKILSLDYRKIDVATIANQVFVGSAGIGLIPTLADELLKDRPPRFSLGWSKLALKAANNVEFKKMVVKVDAFRFEASPIILHVCLLPYSLGLPISTPSVCDDHKAEIVLGLATDPKVFSNYVSQVYKRKYVYGSDIRMYRGSVISIQPAQGMTLYLDGELLELPDNVLEIKVDANQLKVFC